MASLDTFVYPFAPSDDPASQLHMFLCAISCWFCLKIEFLIHLTFDCLNSTVCESTSVIGNSLDYRTALPQPLASWKNCGVSWGNHRICFLRQVHTSQSGLWPEWKWSSSAPEAMSPFYIVFEVELIYPKLLSRRTEQKWTFLKQYMEISLKWWHWSWELEPGLLGPRGFGKLTFSTDTPLDVLALELPFKWWERCVNGLGFSPAVLFHIFLTCSCLLKLLSMMTNFIMSYELLNT